MDTNYLRRSGANPNVRGTLTPATLAASSLWRNSVRTIGDILVLSDIISPSSYLALPFVNQAFYVAGCCYVKDIEQQQNTAEGRFAQLQHSSDPSPEQNKGKNAELFRALLKSVSSNNISTLQKGLARLTTYWAGTAWVADALEQRLAGTDALAIDLVSATEKLQSYLSVPDAGLYRAARPDASGNWTPSTIDIDISELSEGILELMPR